MNLSEEAAAHLCEVITKNLGEAGLFGLNPRLGFMWRNKYTESDYQDVHIHPNCQWSFIIYENNEVSDFIPESIYQRYSKSNWYMR